MNHFTAVNHQPDKPFIYTGNDDRNYHEKFDILLNFIENFIQRHVYR